MNDCGTLVIGTLLQLGLSLLLSMSKIATYNNSEQLLGIELNVAAMYTVFWEYTLFDTMGLPFEEMCSVNPTSYMTSIYRGSI